MDTISGEDVEEVEEGEEEVEPVSKLYVTILPNKGIPGLLVLLPALWISSSFLLNSNIWKKKKKVTKRYIKW